MKKYKVILEVEAQDYYEQSDIRCIIEDAVGRMTGIYNPEVKEVEEIKE